MIMCTFGTPVVDSAAGVAGSVLRTWSWGDGWARELNSGLTFAWNDIMDPWRWSTLWSDGFRAHYQGTKWAEDLNTDMSRLYNCTLARLSVAFVVFSTRTIGVEAFKGAMAALSPYVYGLDKFMGKFSGYIATVLTKKSDASLHDVILALMVDYQSRGTLLELFETIRTMAGLFVCFAKLIQSKLGGGSKGNEEACCAESLLEWFRSLRDLPANSKALVLVK